MFDRKKPFVSVLNSHKQLVSEPDVRSVTPESSHLGPSENPSLCPNTSRHFKNSSASLSLSLSSQVQNVPGTLRLPEVSSRRRASPTSTPTTWTAPSWSSPPRCPRSWWSSTASTWSPTPRRRRAPSADTTGWRSGTASPQVRRGGLAKTGVWKEKKDGLYDGKMQKFTLNCFIFCELSRPSQSLRLWLRIKLEWLKWNNTKPGQNTLWKCKEEYLPAKFYISDAAFDLPSPFFSGLSFLLQKGKQGNDRWR